MEFRILGPFEVLDDGRPVVVDGAKQRALLALLVIHANEALSTPRLIDELWGERPPATAAKMVQVHVSRLRKALARSAAEGARALATRERGYQLQIDRDRVDSHRFERLIFDARRAAGVRRPARALPLLENALSLWRGPPLAEFEQERFAQAEIARLEELRAGALEELIDAKLTLGRHAEVVASLERLIAEYPYRERLRGLLMLALYRSDRQADALQAYQDARRTLVEELGIQPGERLRELERAILAQDRGLEITVETQAVAEAAPGSPRTAFVGRESELSQLLAGLEETSGGHGRLFLLVGEPGIGKSRLAEEIARQARTDGARVLVGRCWEAGGAPAFWPWVQSLRSYVQDSDREDLVNELGPGAVELAPILPELYSLVPGLPQPIAPDSDGARFRLFHATAEFLRRASASRPITLLLDDLHAADTPSLLLLQFLTRELGSMRVLLLGALRDVDPIPGEPLTAMLTEVTREPIARRLTLSGLSQDEVSEYVQVAAAEIASAELSATLYAETEGNPLFVTETMRLLAIESDPARAKQASSLTVPQTVRDVIARRLAHLSPPCNELLISASVLGREFSMEALGHVCVRPEDELITSLDEATGARVLAELPGSRSRLRFSHVLIRDTIYDRLGPARRAKLHREVGEALEALYAGDPVPHLAELAHHFVEAGTATEPSKAITYARRAAEQAAGALAYEEAVRLYRIAIQALDLQQCADRTSRCELLIALGDAQTRAGDTPSARETFNGAADLARDTGNAEQLARAALGFGGRFLFEPGRDDPRSRLLLEEALRALGDGDRELRARLLARLAGGPLRIEASRTRRAALSQEAVEIARSLADPELLAYALDARFLAIWAADNTEERLAIADEMIQLSESTGDLERLFQGHNYRGWLMLELGDLAAVTAGLETAVPITEKLRQPAQLWIAAVWRAAGSLLRGDFEDAAVLIEEALRLGERTIPWNATITHVLQSFVLAREQGRLADVETAVEAAADANPTYPVLRCALSNLHAELGRIDEARAEFESLAADDFAALPYNDEWLLGMTWLADVCVSLQDREHALTLYRPLLEYRDLHAVGAPEVSTGSVSRALGKLAMTAGRPKAAAEHFEAAIASNQRAGARPATAHSQHEYAQMLIAHGQPELARQHVTEALASYRALKMDSWARKAQMLKQLPRQRLITSRGMTRNMGHR